MIWFNFLPLPPLFHHTTLLLFLLLFLIVVHFLLRFPLFFTLTSVFFFWPPSLSSGLVVFTSLFSLWADADFSCSVCSTGSVASFYAAFLFLHLFLFSAFSRVLFFCQPISLQIFLLEGSAAPPAKPCRSGETQLTALQVFGFFFLRVFFFSAISSVWLSFTFQRSLSCWSPCWSCRSNSFTFTWSLFCSWDGFSAWEFPLLTSASIQRFFSLLWLPPSVFKTPTVSTRCMCSWEVLWPDPRLHGVLKAAGRLNPTQQLGLKVHQSIFQMQIPLLLIFVLIYFSQQPRYWPTLRVCTYTGFNLNSSKKWMTAGQ